MKVVGRVWSAIRTHQRTEYSSTLRGLKGS
jgi:hypothetical protein